MAIGKGPTDSEDIIAEINMTPLIDIMLVLLIIFMVTSSVALESGLSIDLPDTRSQQAKAPGQAVIVSLDGKGNLSVQGMKTSFKNLGASIQEALENEKTNIVILEGDQASTLGRTVEIMEIAKEHGAKKFAIATD